MSATPKPPLIISRDRAHTRQAAASLPFPDHQRNSLELHRQQDLAKQRGMPSIFIVTMARSGSASLVQTLATALDVPVMRISSHRKIVPRWLDCFSSGGAILHDHFGPLPYNLKTLRESGVRQIFVRVRDPRAAAASAVGLSNRKFGSPDDIDYESQMIQTCEQFLIPMDRRLDGGANRLRDRLAPGPAERDSQDGARVSSSLWLRNIPSARAIFERGHRRGHGESRHRRRRCVAETDQPARLRIAYGMPCPSPCGSCWD